MPLFHCSIVSGRIYFNLRKFASLGPFYPYFSYIYRFLYVNVNFIVSEFSATFFHGTWNRVSIRSINIYKKRVSQKASIKGVPWGVPSCSICSIDGTVDIVKHFTHGTHGTAWNTLWNSFFEVWNGYFVEIKNFLGGCTIKGANLIIKDCKLKCKSK